MSGSQYTRCVQSACMTMEQLAALEFPAYGSIYFENAPFDSTLKIPLKKGFSIGPHSSTTYWDRKASQTEKGLTVPAGPWKDLAAYASGLIANDHSKLPSTSSQIDSSRPSYFGTIKEHRSLLNSAQNLLENLTTQPQIRNASYCNKAFEICMQALLIRPFQYSHTSWRDSATAVRQEFLDLAENWDELGLASECPYSPTQAELEINQKEHKAFEHVQELKLMLIKLLHADSDG
ncbi:hypothetical protein EAF00_009505 [Botryotinia globosa]|nr:hypothetical protein EAF00_009505 [Botryotinia globosa]